MLMTLFICWGCGKVTPYFPASFPTPRVTPELGRRASDPERSAAIAKPWLSRPAPLPVPLPRAPPAPDVGRICTTALGTLCHRICPRQMSHQTKTRTCTWRISVLEKRLLRSLYTPDGIRRLIYGPVSMCPGDPG